MKTGENPLPTEESGNGDGRTATPATSGASPSNGVSNGNGANGRAQRDLANDTMKNTPEVRDELINRYRKIIEEGRYDPDLEAVAERMIDQGLLKDL